MNTPLISIITICYNSEAFIEQCMQSVLSQDFGHFEYIVIDGGSTDKTVDIITHYQDKLAYWHSKSDRGIAHAFNQGLEQASGEWIVFLNSDDFYCHDHVLTRMAEILVTSPTLDLVYAQIQLVCRTESSQLVSEVIGQKWNPKKFRLGNIIPHPACFTHRSFYQRYGSFDENYKNAMDYELYLRAMHELKVLFIPDLIVWMRDGGISKTATASSFKESRDAQIKHHVFVSITANILYYFYRLKIMFHAFITR